MKKAFFCAKSGGNPLIKIFSFSTTKIRYDSKILKTTIWIVPEIICPKMIFLQTFILRTLQEYFVFIEKKRKMYVDFMVWDVCCFAVLWLWILSADARGNVNRERKETHREPVGLESGGTSFPQKLFPCGSEHGKVNRVNCSRCNATCLKTCLLLYWPKIHGTFIHYVILALSQILFIFTFKLSMADI